ncbi:hypothetical protein QBC39DRAFT_63056 [Podospora conica]|nr:hypothetical protein QBC39DRAFT_63056 [Schizothecium conicum]
MNNFHDGRQNFFTSCRPWEGRLQLWPADVGRLGSCTVEGGPLPTNGHLKEPRRKPCPDLRVLSIPSPTLDHLPTHSGTRGLPLGANGIGHASCARVCNVVPARSSPAQSLCSRRCYRYLPAIRTTTGDIRDPPGPPITPDEKQPISSRDTRERDVASSTITTSFSDVCLRCWTARPWFPTRHFLLEAKLHSLRGPERDSWNRGGRRKRTRRG